MYFHGYSNIFNFSRDPGIHVKIPGFLNGLKLCGIPGSRDPGIENPSCNIAIVARRVPVFVQKPNDNLW